LIYDTKGFYRCLHCSYKTSITPQCSKCKGLNFSNIGTGTQKVEREISQFFPGARIARADSQTMKIPQSYKEIYRKFSEKHIDILIGTQLISKGWDLPSVSLVGIIDADNILYIPDLDANIRAYQNIVQVSGRSGRPGAAFPGSVVIQTFNPEHFVVKAAATRDFPYLYNKEINERKSLSLPPFGKIIKLIFQDPDLKKVDSESERVFLALSKEQSRQTKIYSPQNPLVSNIRGRWRKQIIIKLTHKIFEVSPGITKTLNFLPNGWIIDVDPITIN
jgi:primosomal protein N' (replication factor Y)